MNTTHEAISNFLGSAIPTFCYEIYRVDGEIHGHKIDWLHPRQAIKGFDRFFHLEGKRAIFYICTNDITFTRSHAINFAKAVYEGKVRRLSVDLTNVNSTAK